MMTKVILGVFLLSNILFGLDDTKQIAFDFRTVYVNYKYDKGFANANALATSVKLKYEKEFYKNLTFGIAFATVQDLGILRYDKSLKRRNMAYLFDKNQDNYSLLHQLYLRYSYAQSFLEIGRFELETPLISSNDSFALSNTFEGFHGELKGLENTILSAGYLTRMSGAWDAAYDGGSFNSMTKQAWAHRADNGKEKYYNLVNDLGVKNRGVAFLGLEYAKDAYKIKLYDYLFLDAYNASFGEMSYTLILDEQKKLLFAGQLIKYNGVGALKNNANPDAQANYATYSAKAEISDEEFKLKFAYTGVSDSPSLHFFGTAGGYPEFASGMMISYFETSLRDANIFAVSPSLNFGDDTNRLKLNFNYAYYDLNSDYTKGGIIGDTLLGDAYMHAYGASFKYIYHKNISWLAKIAQRRLEHGDENLLFRTIVAYRF